MSRWICRECGVVCDVPGIDEPKHGLCGRCCQVGPHVKREAVIHRLGEVRRVGDLFVACAWSGDFGYEIEWQSEDGGFRRRMAREFGFKSKEDALFSAGQRVAELQREMAEDTSSKAVKSLDVFDAAIPWPDSPIGRILRERRRQIEAEGWTAEHDASHAAGELARAAGCYAHHAAGVGTSFGEPWPLDPTQKMKLRNGCMLFWPWEDASWKPSTPDRDLEKAGALILAEMERRDAARRRETGGVA